MTLRSMMKKVSVALVEIATLGVILEIVTSVEMILAEAVTLVETTWRGRRLVTEFVDLKWAKIDGEWVIYQEELDEWVRQQSSPRGVRVRFVMAPMLG